MKKFRLSTCLFLWWSLSWGLSSRLRSPTKTWRSRLELEFLGLWLFSVLTVACGGRMLMKSSSSILFQHKNVKNLKLKNVQAWNLILNCSLGIRLSSSQLQKQEKQNIMKRLWKIRQYALLKDWNSMHYVAISRFNIVILFVFNYYLRIKKCKVSFLIEFIIFNSFFEILQFIITNDLKNRSLKNRLS